ncbi:MULTISPECIES: DUF6352 family protein [unclassified Acidovorax]|jgi:hypothetical protein|uniref:DUF6352 family protein n=1 Tax=unclassified Acidovorax TaxID=2684926 RepID=UPI000B3F6D19|nr:MULTISPECIES: DUF6352 family protein [unclassified Acidovorax]MBP3982574.1 hypothetical protein [Acidovorax sp. JG5]MBU4422678.1 hypothetical protein [Gammaproteobacteria bacterium]
MNSPSDFWPYCGFQSLARDTRGWLLPTDAYFQWILARPELALVPESCAAEVALHQSLAKSPLRPVAPQELVALADDDARENYAVFLRFRDALVRAGTLEAFYLQLMRSGAVNVPAVFIDAVVQALLRNLLDNCNDAFEARAAEMLFRPQRITLHEGQMLAGDRATLDMLNETAGLGDMGRLLLESGALQPTAQVQVLAADNAGQYWQASDRHHFLLDLTHELTQDLSHGLTLKMTRARSGLKALARVLERWVAHLLGVQVQIEPVHQVTDSAWRWHVGLDVESTAILNDLYQDRPVDAERMARLVSLFTLTFVNPAEMRADVAGKPVYLGLATSAEGVVRIKPQNLLLNLPLASAF